jgi:hypothetical protein
VRERVRDNARMREFRFEGGLGPAFRLGTAAPSGGQLDGCARCGAGGPLTSATVRPVHKGGTRSAANLRGLCRACLRLKRAEDR